MSQLLLTRFIDFRFAFRFNQYKSGNSIPKLSTAIFLLILLPTTLVPQSAAASVTRGNPSRNLLRTAGVLVNYQKSSTTNWQLSTA